MADNREEVADNQEVEDRRWVEVQNRPAVVEAGFRPGAAIRQMNPAVAVWGPLEEWEALEVELQASIRRSRRMPHRPDLLHRTLDN